MPPKIFFAQLEPLTRRFNRRGASRVEKAVALREASVVLPHMKPRSLRNRLRAGSVLRSSLPGNERRGRRPTLTKGEVKLLYKVWELDGFRSVELFLESMPRLLRDMDALGRSGYDLACREKVGGLCWRTLHTHLHREHKRAAVSRAARDTSVVFDGHGAGGKHEARPRDGPWLGGHGPVFHSGGDLSGKHAYSYMSVSVFCDWVEIFACRSLRSEDFALPLTDALGRFPFRVHGVHSDCGTAFVNAQVGKALGRVNIKPTRSRSGKSNDNALAEQKNGDVALTNFGWGFIHAEETEAMNVAHRLICGHVNYFGASVKLVHKEREGAKVKRKHDRDAAPLNRLVDFYKESGKRIPAAVRCHLKAREELNSILSLEEIRRAMMDLTEKRQRRAKIEMEKREVADAVNV